MRDVKKLAPQPLKERENVPARRGKNHVESGRSALLTIRDIGWTREKAADVRAQLASFVDDWDDPAMNVYDDL